MMTNNMARKFFLMHVPMLICLFILTDHETNYSDDDTGITHGDMTKRHLALFTALSRHQPSMRVYRGIFELIILGFCSSLSLYIWEGIVDKKVIAKLIFQHPYTLKKNGNEIKFYHEYELAEMTVNNNIVEGDEKLSLDESQEQINSHDTIDIPSSSFVLNKTLDCFLLFLISLFLFTISSSAGGQYIDQTISFDNDTKFNALSEITAVAAPIFPLLLFMIFAIQLFLPWNESKFHFWTCISYTLGAPFYDVTFRDGFIGDIFTSMVRPMQDLAFTTFYLFCGLQGWWVYRKDDQHKTSTLEEDDILQPVEHSWLLHTIILPACMLSPLWWRFCQTLRQCYDTRKRWPYLGNAFKYFLAAQVVILGVFFEPKKDEYFFIWVILYVSATLYQIIWDIFMDWEIFVWAKDGSYFELREKRLYPWKSMYYIILAMNIILRFGWILNFIPLRYLSQATGQIEYTFSADFASFASPFLACAEIIRRTMWGFIRFELEALKTIDKDINSKDSKLEQFGHSDDGDGIEMKPMSIASSVNNTKVMSFKSFSSVTFRNDMSTANDVQVLWELCAYATIFMATAAIAAIHRQVL